MTDNVLSTAQIRAAVISYLHFKGDCFHRLNRSQWEECFFLADGFGQLNQDSADHQTWDQLHINNSSPAAFSRIWDEICYWHNTGKLWPQRAKSENRGAG